MAPIEITMTIFFTITVLIVACHFIPRIRVIYIKPVSAGIPKSEDLVKDIVIGKLSKEDYSFYKSQKINPHKYKFKKVNGNCMTPKKIALNDIVLVKEFPLLENLFSSVSFFMKRKKARIKPGDVLFIDFVDEKSQRRIKLREFVSWDKEEYKAVTQCYGDNDEIHPSSATHPLKYIYGIVRFVDHRNTD
ncbi:MAG: hypothetical protein LBC98_05390 [Prevotellaceae bacterium]|jgi:hypothetical protein|nr:hypothetical protein [Prevotellaceae bacterium]